ncbi:MAG TPA: substrate-binding domain-containing protein, partial [Vicinamibacteria bacterium]|nr:substrate-binding domain-containing protein [Vicinamibacteria bacterium]
MGVVPKSTRNPYFQDCRRGALEAAQELGFALQWDGPQSADAVRQAQIVEGWVKDGLPVIAVSVESSARLTPVLKEARARGTKVLTWDSDAEPEARDFTVVHATADGIAHALSFEVGRILGGKGTLAAITSTLSAPNQTAWIAEFKSRLAREYPGITLVAVRPCNDVEENAKREVTNLLETQPDLKAIVGFCSPAVPGAAEALLKAGRRDVRLTGVSLPSACRSYIESGVVESVVMWKTRNLGYLVGASALAVATGSLAPGAASFRAGRLGTVVVVNEEIRLGRCHIVTKGNIQAF